MQCTRCLHESDERIIICDRCGFNNAVKYTEEQSPPVRSDGPDCWLLVLSDMEERRKHGIEKYKHPVRSFNGRDPLVDAYQEALDLCVYLRQAIEERKTHAPSN